LFDPASVALGLFGGIGGPFVVERYRHRKDLRQRGAAVLGPIQAMLVERVLSEKSGGHAYAVERDRIRDLRSSSQMTATPAVAARSQRRAGC
jgi:hypothetical protein